MTLKHKKDKCPLQNHKSLIESFIDNFFQPLDPKTPALPVPIFFTIFVPFGRNNAHSNIANVDQHKDIRNYLIKKHL
jgi:hypothetical protein